MCLLKHENDWEGANKRMYISNTSRRDLSEELDLVNEKSLAIYLIGLHNEINAEPVQSRYISKQISFTAFISNSPHGEPRYSPSILLLSDCEAK